MWYLLNENICPYWKEFVKAANITGLSPFLLAAIGWVESRYNPEAVSSAGAKGIMQIMPNTWNAWGSGDIFNPHDNIFAGSNYLRWCIAVCARKYKDAKRMGIASYYWGIGRVLRCEDFDSLPYTVKGYVNSVLAEEKRIINHYLDYLRREFYGYGEESTR